MNLLNPTWQDIIRIENFRITSFIDPINFRTITLVFFIKRDTHVHTFHCDYAIEFIGRFVDGLRYYFYHPVIISKDKYNRIWIIKKDEIEFWKKRFIKEKKL